MIPIRKFLFFVFCCYIPNITFASPLFFHSKYQQDTEKSQQFYFGNSSKNNQGTLINAALVYHPTRGYGYGFDYDTATNVKIATNSFFTDKPTYFSVQLPEGNYQVEVVMGSNEFDANVTIKAESRRLFLDQLDIKKGKEVTKTFNVNIRSTTIDDKTKVSLKEREKDDLNWDDKLTLEFLGIVSIKSITITKVDNATVVYLAGDSTVTDQDIEPWGSWGQFITNYFDKQVVIANYAYSGSALSSFKAGNRLKKILSVIKPNDYLFVEFGHNDEKIKGVENGAWHSYSDLLKEFAEAARKKGAIPVLITPTQRRVFNSDGILNPTHGDFPDAMRSVAQKNNFSLIDLTQLTTQLYEKWGDEPSRKAFVQYPANTFPGQDKALEDNTHFNSFGANEIALCVIKGIRDLNLPLKKHIIKEIPFYDPNNPNSISDWTLPMSSRFEITKPDGN